MKSKAIFMALLALAYGAQAVPVDVENAKLAARAWAYRGATLGARIGDTVEGAATHSTSNGVKFYAIKMKGGGTVFMSSDTEVEPVICFTSESGDFSSIDPKSPLWALLSRDMAFRAKRPAIQNSTGQTASGSKWSKLLAEGERLANQPVMDRAGYRTSVGDLRVPMLVKSQWDQLTDLSGKNCYNYYTPRNYYCGCVATAMSQYLRYCFGPVGDGGLGMAAPKVKEGTFLCTVDGEDVYRTVDGLGYQWDKMPLTPSSVNSDEERQAIGKLTSDVGATVNMEYTGGGSGAMSVKEARSLINVFGFKQAVFTGVIWVTDTFEFTDDKLQRAMFSNMDAGYPVMLSITGALGGHAIVADGYGYNDGLPYVHLNMGWSGMDNLWYNLPNMKGRDYADFDVLQGITYNAFPNKSGAVLSGRTLDKDGQSLSGVKVTVRKYNTDEVVAETTSSNYGTWGVILDAGTYDVLAVTEDLSLSGEGKKITIKNPESTLTQFGPVVANGGEIGNHWGLGITLEEVVYENSVQNARTSVKYGTLDQAIESATTNDTLLILSTTLLRNPQTIDKNLTIRTADGVSPADAPVNCRTAAVHGFTSVTNGAELALKNVVFNGTKGCFVYVHSNAFLSVSGTVGLSEGSYVHTEDERGIKLAGELSDDCYLTVDCLVATGLGQQFGTCPDEAFAASASHFLNPYDEDLGGEMVGSKLVWSRVPIDPSIAIAYFTGDAGENKQYYRKISTLFDDHQEDSGDVVILKDCELKLPAFVRGTKHLICTNEADAAAITFNARTNASFYVEAGASLSVSNLVFTGATRQSVFVVEGGELTLDADTLIVDCANTVGNSQDFITRPSGGAVTVHALDYDNPGKLTMLAGSVISNCTTTGCGGGVYVGGVLNDLGACSFDLFDGKIVNCSADGFGGGAYVGYGSTINVKGEATVTGCRSATMNSESVSSDNVDLSEGGTLVLAGELTGRVNVYGYSDYWMYGNENGLLFGTIAEACDETTATNSAYNFRCDVRSVESNRELRGEYVLDEDGNRMLAWSEEPVPVQDVEPEYPVAWVIYDQEDGSTLTNKYGTLDEALASITDDATVEITEWDMLPDYPGDYYGPTEDYNKMTSLVARLTKSVVIEHDVLLRTTPDEGPWINTIWQSGQGRVTVANGGKLTLENVIFDGINPVLTVTGVTTNDDVEITSFNYALELGGDSGVLEVSGEGSELILSEDALVYDFYGSASRAAAAVNVVEKGTLRLLDGAEVGWCINSFRKDAGQPENNPAPAGGILVNDGLLSLEGGCVHDCGAIVGGGVLAENGSRVEVSGSPTITNNYLLVGSNMPDPTKPETMTNANLSVANEAVNGMPKLSELVLVGEFTGEIGILEPRMFGQFVADAEIDTNVFGKVSVELNPMNFQASAANFKRDIATGVTGKIALSGNPDNPALLVWPSALGEGGTYTNPETGEEYDNVEDFQAVDYPVPISGLVYDGTLKTGVVEHAGYTLTGNTAIPAGEYMATATLNRKWMWTDGTVGPVKVNWSIAKATCVIPDAAFTNVTYVYDGTAKSNFVDEAMLPAGVSVTNYLNNGQTEIGVYTVTAQFGDDTGNYEPIADKTATLTIIGNIEPPTALTGLVYNGNEQTGVVANVGFTLTGNVGTNAGTYTAVAKLIEGYTWAGGGTADVTVDWQIAKATYDMSGVVFTNVTYVCDGTAKSNLVDEATLPSGVSVTNYLNNGQTEIGVYTVTAQFGGDEENYEPIDDMTAELTITPKQDPDPDPEYTVTTNDPSMTPLAFSNIVRIAETEWSLSLTNLLKDAEYALSFTDDLTTPFTTGAWFRAESSGLWTTNWLFKSGEAKPAYFWRAHGRTTYVTNWLNAVPPQPQP